VEVWVTVACSKTRAAIEGLQRAGERYQTRSCLDEPPTADELEDVLARLGAEPWEIARDPETLDRILGT
jgi:arsenate reductase